MSYKKVTDHVDIISSQLWKQLLNGFIDRCKAYADKNPNLTNIANILMTLPIPTSGKPVRPSIYNNMVTACKELTQTLGEDPPSGLRTVTSGDIVFASDINALIDCLNLVPLNFVIYLFDTNDWNTAKNYVTENSFIFVNYDINTLTNTEVSDLVSRLPVLFVNMIDTQPYHNLPAPAFYNVFYNVLAPPNCLPLGQWDYIYVGDSCFESFLSFTTGVLIDYAVHSSYKIEPINIWGYYPTLYLCSYSYKKYKSGAIIEIPFDSFWLSLSTLTNYINAMSNCVMGFYKPSNILYLGYYPSDLPGGHKCYPIDNCWQQFASQFGYKIVDLRRK